MFLIRVMANRGRYNANTSLVDMNFFSMCANMRLYACVILFIFPSILLLMNCHSDYDSIDSRVAGNRRPYFNIFRKYKSV